MQQSSQVGGLGSERSGPEIRGATSTLGAAETREREQQGSSAGGAQSLMHQAREQVRAQAGTVKDRAADEIAGAADRVHEAAEQLRSREAWLADVMDRGAQELDRFASAMKQRDIGSLFGAVEDFAKRQPALFAGASVAVGFALARLGKGAISTYHPEGSYHPEADREHVPYGTSSYGDRVAGGMAESGSSYRSAGYGAETTPTTLDSMSSGSAARTASPSSPGTTDTPGSAVSASSEGMSGTTSPRAASSTPGTTTSSGGRE